MDRCVTKVLLRTLLRFLFDNVAERPIGPRLGEQLPSSVHIRKGEKKFRVRLEDGNFFYLAVIWEPAMGDWPVSYRIITVDANPDVIPYQERHGAIIQRRHVMQWIDYNVPESDLLVTPTANLFSVEEISRLPAQGSLAH